MLRRLLNNLDRWSDQLLAWALGCRLRYSWVWTGRAWVCFRTEGIVNLMHEWPELRSALVDVVIDLNRGEFSPDKEAAPYSVVRVIAHSREFFGRSPRTDLSALTDREVLLVVCDLCQRFNALVREREAAAR